MSTNHQIVIEFPSKKLMKEFCAQMSDGWGEGFCDFSFYRQIEGTDGTKREHFFRVTDESGRDVYFVDDVFEP